MTVEILSYNILLIIIVKRTDKSNNVGINCTKLIMYITYIILILIVINIKTLISKIYQDKYNESFNYFKYKDNCVYVNCHLLKIL